MKMDLKNFNIINFVWRDISHIAKLIVPPLTFQTHKGEMGRIGIIGGSKDYTGAPFYASDAALKFGADLSFVFSSSQASTPIKCYSPELMVTPIYDDKIFEDAYNENGKSVEVDDEIKKMVKTVEDTLPRLHSLVIGPGLGRNPYVMEGVAAIIEIAKEKKINIVIDADGLWMLTHKPTLLQGYSRSIITPNKVEFDRLIDSMKNHFEHSLSNESLEEDHRQFYINILKELSSDSLMVQTRALSISMGGVTILRKGEKDILSSGSDVFVLNENGSPRRCGGQGDLLAGGLGVSLYWASKMNIDNFVNAANEIRNLQTTLSSNCQSIPTSFDIVDASNYLPHTGANTALFLSKRPTKAGGLGTASKEILNEEGRIRQGTILACILAASTVKQASKLAFVQTKRSTTTPVILNQIGEAFDQLINSE